ncbi:MAG: threonylcarbamoyl-AMP synthase [Lachnospiraceae bacterium]|jgi:L-threonylcarbamoyladenylate synthase|nr:threonylcarbamoyl-AMP synthase [Lachnospiraceae bacterium]
MDTIIQHLDGSAADIARIEEAGAVIRRGGLVAFPTETVYGLGGDALNAEAAGRIYAAKGRPADNPLIVHLCRTTDAEAIAAEIPPVFYSLAERFWPGPLTMILKKSPRVPDNTTGGLATVALRMPDNEVALRFIAAAGGFVAAPSANRSGRPSPTTLEHVIADMAGRVEMIIGGGEARIGLESTIVDLTVAPARVLRPGYVTAEEIAPIVEITGYGRLPTAPTDDVVALAPGTKYRHYQPQGRLTVVEGEAAAVIAYINEQVANDRANGATTGVIATEESRRHYQADHVKSLGARGDEVAVAHNLYRALREFDDAITDVIYSEAFTGEAVRDRLLRAAAGRVVKV